MMTAHSPQAAKYAQISQQLHNQIMRGTLPPNQQLPTEAVLTQQFGVSRGTVRKAVDLLESEGVVRREQGRGTFVNDVGGRYLAGFELQGGQQQRQTSVQVLKQEIGVFSAEIHAQLNLNPDALLIHIARLHHADTQPTLYEERYLDAKLCPQLVTEDVEKQSIHWLLVHKYQLPLVRVTHTVELRQVGSDSAELLNLHPTDTAFVIERLTHTTHDDAIRPAVYYRALCRSDEYQFKAQFNTMI